MPRDTDYLDQLRDEHPDFQGRMTPMQEVVLVLSATYTSEGVATWLAGRNKKLEDERPIELLAAGDSTRVLEAAYVLLGMVAS